MMHNIEYKDSGINWIGKIPVSWGIVPCRALVIERDEKNSDLNYSNYLSLMSNVGVIPYEEKGDIGNKKPDDLSKCKIVHEGDFVINSMNYYIGSYGISRYTGVCSPVYIVIFPNTKVVRERFAFRIFENRNFQSLAQTFGNGILEHRRAISWDILKNLKVPLPPIDQQDKIIKYLDQKTIALDALIEEKQKLSELLIEKRQAMISEAVTKGLDKNVSLIDSGVDWIGRIPKSWQIKRLRYVGSCQNGINKSGDEFGFGSPFVSYGDVYKNEVIPREVEGLLNTTKKEQAVYSVEENDVFFTRTSETIDEIGYSSVCFTTIEKAAFAGFLIRFRPYENMLYKGYSKYYFQCRINRQFFVKEMNLVTRASLSQELLKNFPIIIPPISEQQRISEYLDKRTEEIDNLVNDILIQCDKLKEYRQSIISEAVTGKVAI